MYTLYKKSPSKRNLQTFAWLGQIQQIPHVIFETAIQFFLNFASLCSVMRDSFCTFLAETLYDLNKGAHQNAKFWTFDCSSKNSLNLYFGRLLLLKVHKISAEKWKRSYVSRYRAVMQNLKKNWFATSKMTRIWWISTWALKIH